MPRIGNQTNNKDALQGALEAAPNLETVWLLIRGWRKRRFHALETVARSTPFWDEGMVQEMAGSSHLLGIALNNPSWPAWATEAVMDRINQTFAGELSLDAADAAFRSVQLLAGRGLINGQSNGIGEMLSALNGRKELVFRQIMAARSGLAMADLSSEWVNHIVGALDGSKNMVGQRHYYAPLHGLIEDILKHPQTTEEAVLRLANNNPTTIQRFAQIEPKWAGINVTRRAPRVP